MPSIPPQRRYLSASGLRAVLSTSKPIVLTDTPPPPTTSRPPHRQPLPSASTSAVSVRSLAWSPLGNFLAVADPRSLRIWNPDKPQLKFTTELRPPIAQQPIAQPISRGPLGTKPLPAPLHLVGTERVAWNPVREAELASVGSDGVVRFWDVRSRVPCVGEVKIGGEGISMVWRPDGEELVVGRRDDTLHIISRPQLTILSTHPQNVQTNQLAFSNSGAELFLTTGDSQVRILDYPSMTPLHAITPHTSSVTCCAQCPRGRHIGIGGSDALVTIWDTADLTCLRSIADITGPVRCVSFSFDGCFLVAGSDERNEGAPGNAPTGNGAAAKDATVRGNGGVGAGGEDLAGEGAASTSGLSIYAVDSGECVYTIETLAATSCVEWHPSRYSLAYSGETGGVKIVGESGR